MHQVYIYQLFFLESQLNLFFFQKTINKLDSLSYYFEQNYYTKDLVERYKIIEKYKEVKKGTEESVPFLEPIQYIENNWYLMKNSKLWLINLSINQIDDQYRDTFKILLQQTEENIQVIMMNHSFDEQKVLQKTKKKFGKKLVL